MVVFDATMLMLLFRPDAGQPQDSGGKRVTQVPERIKFLTDSLQKSKTKIIVPTPALSETLVHAGMDVSQSIVEEMNRSAVFHVADFDLIAAIEVAAMTRNAIVEGGKRGAGTGTWAKIKYDRQIVAIARAARASAIYSDDENVRTFAQQFGMPVIRTSDLPLPPEEAQPQLPFKAPEDELEAAIEAEETARPEGPEPPIQEAGP
ncbi:MAG: hypothetical protein JOY77_13860 [Alphaproteobacteria bacterium]|nr:hypothetical protein [Alphaproteobacteria bacterium]MBV9063994.1 hypothetical protein [Alphaproteobacteria bacterium]